MTDVKVPKDERSALPGAASMLAGLFLLLLSSGCATSKAVVVEDCPFGRASLEESEELFAVLCDTVHRQIRDKMPEEDMPWVETLGRNCSLLQETIRQRNPDAACRAAYRLLLDAQSVTED